MKLFRKNIYFTILLYLLSNTIVLSQRVSYTYRALAAEGCTMFYSVARQDTSYYIVATVRSDRMQYLSEPTMKIRTFNDEVFELKGVSLGSGSESAGILMGNIMVPVTEINSTAQFKIMPQQFEMIKNGVAKIRLSMTPMNHERTFKKDKIGKKLYKFYLKAKEQDDTF